MQARLCQQKNVLRKSIYSQEHGQAGQKEVVVERQLGRFALEGQELSKPAEFDSANPELKEDP